MRLNLEHDRLLLWQPVVPLGCSQGAVGRQACPWEEAAVALAAQASTITAKPSHMLGIHLAARFLRVL